MARSALHAVTVRASKSIMLDMAPTLWFHPTRASLHLGVSQGGVDTRSISFVVDIDPETDVFTADKRSLRSATWTMSLLDSERFNEHAANEGAMGVLSYFPESTTDYESSEEACHLSAAIGADTFSALLGVLTAGRLPHQLSASVKGMTYGRAFDGKDSVWDVAVNRVLPIMEIRINIPLASAVEFSSEDPENVVGAKLVLPASSSDMRAVGDRLTSVVNDLRVHIARYSKYLIAIGVLMLLIALMK